MPPTTTHSLLLLFLFTCTPCTTRAEAAAEPAPILSFLSSTTGRPAEVLTPPPGPYEPPFYRRIATWFGFGDDAAIEASTPTLFHQQLQRRSGNTVDPQPSPNGKRKTACNPCNKVPWTPIIQSRQRQFPSASAASSNSAAVALNGYPVYASYRSPLAASAGQSAAQLELQPDVEPHTSYGPPTGPPPIKLIDGSSVGSVNYGLPARQQLQPFNAYAPPSPTAIKADFAGHAVAQQRPYSPAGRHYQSGHLPYSYQHLHQQYQVARPYHSNGNGNGVQVQAQPLRHIALPTYTSPYHPAYRPRFVPIPVPNLSQQPLPPLFAAKSFHAPVYGYADQKPVQSNGDVALQIVPRTPAPTAGAPVATGYPTAVTSGSRTTEAASSNPADDVEIIRSVPLAEFTSSVLYPIQVGFKLCCRNPMP